MKRFNAAEIKLLQTIIDAIEFHSVSKNLKLNSDFHIVYDCTDAINIKSIRGKLSRRSIHVLDLDDGNEYEAEKLEE